MFIKFTDTKQDILDVIKQYRKKNNIIFYIACSYLMICSIAFFFEEIIAAFLLLVFTSTLLITKVYRDEKTKKLTQERFNRSFGDEVERIIEFKEDKFIYSNNKTPNQHPFNYDEITQIIISKKYIIITNKYKEWVYIKKELITLEEYNNILNIFKSKNIKIKGE